MFLVKTKTPQIIRVKSPPANAHRKRRVIALLETAVEGIASSRYHPQPGMQCSWCQFSNECMALASRPGAAGKEGGLMQPFILLAALLLVAGRLQ